MIQNSPHSSTDEQPFYEHPYGFIYYIVKYASVGGFAYKEFSNLEEAKKFSDNMNSLMEYKPIKIIKREVVDESLF